MSECAIPMCGYDEEENGRLVPCCGNGHFLHPSCLALLKDNLACPMCRSECLKSMLQTSTSPMDVLCQTPYSQFGAAVAVYIGKMEHDRYATRQQPRIVQGN